MSDIKLPDGWTFLDKPPSTKQFELPGGWNLVDYPSDDILPKAKITRIIQGFPDPDEEAARINNAAFVYQHFNVSPEEAYDYVDEYITQLTGEEKPPHKKFAQDVRDSWTYGQQIVQLGKMRWREMLTVPNEELSTDIEILKSQMKSPEYAERSLPIQALLNAAEVVPTMWAGIQRGAKTGLLAGAGGAAVAAIAGQIGPQIILPEEAVTVPNAFLTLFSVGFVTGTAQEMMEIEGGLAFDEMLESAIDPAIAKPIAITVGTINGLIETVQIDELLKTFPGGKALFRRAVTRATKKVIAEGGLKKIALRFAAQYGKHIGFETFQELIQETTTILGTEIAKEFTIRRPGSRGMAPVHATSEEILERFKQTAIHSALAFSVMALPGTSMSAVMEAQQALRIEAPIELSPEEEKLIRTLSEGLTVETTTPETELGRRLSRAARERIAPSPVNERLEIANEVEDIQERERVLSGEIPISEVLSEEIKEVPAREVSGEESLRENARQFKTAPEFLEYVYSTLLTPDDVAEMDKPILDMRLRQFWTQSQEEEAVTETTEPGIVPTIEESRKAFLDTYDTPESVEVFLSTLAAKTKKKGSRKGLSLVWWAGARHGKPASPEGWVRMRKEMENNPDKFRKVFAEIMEDTDELRMIEQQERQAAETAQEPVMIPENEAVELAMKKAKQAARKAFYEGKRIGIKEERVRKAELLRRASEKKKLRAYITKLAAQIAKKPGKSIDFFYREAIENLQADIDPHFRRASTLEARERTRKFIAERPGAEEIIPKKVQAILEKRSLNEITVAELETLRNEIDILRKIGRTKKQLEIIQHNRDVQEQRDILAQAVLRGEKLQEETQPVVRATKEEGRVKKVVRFARAFTLRPSRIFDKLDGGKRFQGDWHRIFYDEINELENDKIRAVDERLDPGKAKRKKLDISLGDLARAKVEVDGVKYTLDEALDIYAGFQNESKTLAIIYGNNIDQPTAQKIIDSLIDKEKALADYIIADYEKRYEMLRNAHIAFMDEDLGHEENYTPIRRTDVDYETLNEELRDELLRKTHLKKGYAEKGFTITRQEIPPEYQKPIRLGLVSTWLDQVPKQEHYIHYANKIRDLHRLLNDKQLSAAVRQRFGDEYYDAVRHYVDRVANPNIYKSFHHFERMSQTLRKHTALAYLSYNLVTMGKQLPSVFLYLPDAGPGHLLAAAAEFAIHPFKTMEFVNELDPQMKHRSIEREMEELKRYNASAFDRIIKAVGKPGMIGIYAMDKIATTIGWKAVYDANIKKGMSEAEAAREAQNVTLRTQPAAHAKDVAELYATSEFLNWFTQFTNQLSQVYNIITYDIPQTFKQHQYYRGILQIASMGMVSLGIWALSNRRLPEKPEDFKDAAKDQLINMIPLVGKIIAAKDRGWSMDVPAPLEAIGDLYGIFKDPGWIKKSPLNWFTDRRFQKAMEKALEGISVLFGIPYIGPKRVRKAIQERDVRELVGGRPRR